MSVNARELFSGMGGIKTSEGGRYIMPGRYHLKLKEMKVFESTRTRGDHYFVAEFEIMETSATMYAAGDPVSWLVSLRQREIGQANVKSLLKALLAVSDDADVNAEVMEGVLGADQPLAGTNVWADAFEKEKVNTPGEFYTRINWSCGAISIRSATPAVA